MNLDRHRARRFLMLGLFVVLGVAAFGLTGVVVGVAGVPALWLPALSVMLLGATWICLRIEGRKFRDLGLRLTGSRLRELGAGFVVGAGLFAAMTFVQGPAGRRELASERLG